MQLNVASECLSELYSPLNACEGRHFTYLTQAHHGGKKMAKHKHKSLPLPKEKHSPMYREIARLYKWTSLRKDRTSNKLVFLVGLTVLICSSIILFRFQGLLSPLRDPGIALGCIPLFFGLAAGVGHIAFYSRGALYMLMREKRRVEFDGPPERPKNVSNYVTSTGPWGGILKTIYWIFILAGIFMVSFVVVGTINSPTNSEI